MRPIAILLLLGGFTLAWCQQPPGQSSTASDAPAQETKSSQESSGSASERVIKALDPGLLIHKVQPVYPKKARKAGIQGTVVLRALIGTDGTVKDLHVESGDPILAEAALKAVKQWTYKPYYLEGRAVEVDTTINVNFALQ